MAPAITGGGLELAALSAQDAYLTCNPECTWWKKAFCRYTNYAIVQVTQSIGSGSNSPLIGSGSAPTVNVQIQRVADLVGPMYVRSVLPALNTVEFNSGLAADVAGADLINDGAAGVYTSAALTGELNGSTYPAYANVDDGYCYVDAVGLYLVQNATCQIGGHQFDELRSEQQYLEWVSEHTDETILRYAIGMGSDMERTARAYEDQIIYSPLQFWHTKMTSHYLAHIAIAGHEHYVRMTGRSADDLWGCQTGSAFSTSAAHAALATDRAAINAALVARATHDLVYDGVLLDRAERMMTARMAIEVMATEHLHYMQTSVGAGQAQITLNSLPLNHPTRDLHIALRRRSNIDSGSLAAAVPSSELYPFRNSVNVKTNNRWNDFSGGSTGSGEKHGHFAQLQLALNNYDRFGISENIGGYYSEVHPAQKYCGNTRDTHAAFYSFAVKEQGEVKGTLNFSAIDNVGLRVTRRPNLLTSYLPQSGGVAGFNRDTMQHEAVDVILATKTMNVYKYVSGMIGRAFAS